MFEFTDDERAYLLEIRGITADSSGREVLAGLTREVAEFYMQDSRDWLPGRSNRGNRARYLQLNEKHERERLAVIGAEVQLRNETPPLHYA